MSRTGTATLRQQIIDTIFTNAANEISGDDVQSQLIDSLDSLSKRTYLSTIAYEVNETIIFGDVDERKQYICVTNTTPGESPLTNPEKWEEVVGVLELGLDGEIPFMTGTDNFAYSANLKWNGTDLLVNGSPLLSQIESRLIDDSHLYLNNGYKAVEAQTGGLVVNYLPTATNDTVATGGFTAGVDATSNPTVATTGAAIFAVGDFIQIDGASELSNNGLFEVLSHATNVLTIRGIGTTARVEDFTQDQFVTDTTASGTITKVNVSVLRAGTDGVWQTASGSSTGLSFSGIGSSSVGTSGYINYADGLGGWIQSGIQIQGGRIIETGSGGLRLSGDTSGEVIIGGAGSTATQLVLGESTDPASGRIIQANGVNTDISLILKPKGVGYVITDGTFTESIGTIADGDATPDVSGANVFTYEGTSNVTITNLDNAVVGAKYTLVANNTGNITINRDATFKLDDSTFFCSQIGDNITLLCISTGVFIELSRSVQPVT